MGSGTRPRAWQVRFPAVASRRVGSDSRRPCERPRARVCHRGPARLWTQAGASRGARCLCFPRRRLREIARSTGGRARCLGRYRRASAHLVFFLTQAFSPSPRVCTGEEVATRDPSFSLRWPRTCTRRKKGLALPSPAARPPPAHAQRLLTGPLAPDHTLVCVLLKCSLFASQLFFFHKVRGACIWVFVSSKDLQRLRVWHVTGMSQRPERHSHSVLNSCLRG